MVELCSVPCLSILIALLLALLSIFLLFKGRGLKKNRTILLIGKSSAGKTGILGKLLSGAQHCPGIQNTVTSMKENCATYDAESKTWPLVDVPGQDRIFGSIFEKFRSSTYGLIFVLDAAELQKNLRDVAEHLYAVLSDPTFASTCRQVLIACHKSDLLVAKKSSVVRTMLEKEITTLRLTRAATLKDTEESSVEFLWLGKREKDFKFDDTRLYYNITFCESSILSEGDVDGLKEVKSWLNSL